MSDSRLRALERRFLAGDRDAHDPYMRARAQAGLRDPRVDPIPGDVLSGVGLGWMGAMTFGPRTVVDHSPYCQPGCSQIHYCVMLWRRAHFPVGLAMWRDASEHARVIAFGALPASPLSAARSEEAG